MALAAAQVKEGCEGGIEPLGRLTSYDLESGSSTVLIPELALTDHRFVMGPEGRFAIVAGCDASAWLAAVGRIGSDGGLESLETLNLEEEEWIRGGANAGVSITWASGGDVLFFDSTRVDAATGQRIDAADPDSRIRVHAELAGGTRLVAAPTGELDEFFWVDDGSASLEELTSTPPDFSAQSTFPAIRVEIAAAGDRAYAVFEDWEVATAHTAVIGGDEVLQIEGRAVPSPSGSSLLVRAGVSDQPSDWSVVDLASGASSPVPLPEGGVDSWFFVEWGSSDDELLISMGQAGGPPLPPISVWLVARSA